jgi:uncharacterized protein (UPF0333 family)
MKKSKINISIVFTFLTVLCVVFLAGCAPKLSEDFNEAEVKQAAENVIDLLNAQDSEGLRALFTTQMNAAITDEVLTQIYAALAEGGPFETIENMIVAGSTDQSSGVEYAVVTVQAKYKLRSFIYTISFDKQLNLAGLYYK